MLAEDFILKKRPAWEKLDQLIKRSRHGLMGLTAAELRELGQLYRQATSDLAVARRDYPKHPVQSYLNGLVGQAHGYVYRGKSTRLQSLLTYFGTTLPRIFRETWLYTLASFGMFFLPALVSFVLAYRDPEAVTIYLPGFQDVISDIKQGHEWWKSINEQGNAASASFIMTNNIRVAFLAFAGGILFGTLSLYVLATNGIMLGCIAGVAQRFAFGDNLWGFVAAHGVVELSVIFIAGGAGLQLGWSLLRPGLLSRGSALKVATRRAFLLLAGCVPLLVIAGTIEGFISPSSLPLAVKIFVAVASGIIMYGYFFLAGREQRV